jgi:hypothetical protein
MCANFLPGGNESAVDKGTEECCWEITELAGQ